jgi:hypothetical protein
MGMRMADHATDPRNRTLSTGMVATWLRSAENSGHDPQCVHDDLLNQFTGEQAGGDGAEKHFAHIRAP